MHDPLLPGLLERQSAETLDQVNESRRGEDRQTGFYHLYVDNDDPEEFVERRFVTEIPSEHVGAKVMVKCLQLKLESDVEPLFASMAIYDAKEKKKLSESFHFDLNAEAIKKMLSSHVPYADMSTQSRTALFEVTHPSHELYLVIRLEKVLQGDTAEPYLKLVVQEDKEKVRDEEVVEDQKRCFIMNYSHFSSVKRRNPMQRTFVSVSVSIECHSPGRGFVCPRFSTGNLLPLARKRKRTEIVSAQRPVRTVWIESHPRAVSIS